MTNQPKCISFCFIKKDHHGKKFTLDGEKGLYVVQSNGHKIEQKVDVQSLNCNILTFLCIHIYITASPLNESNPTESVTIRRLTVRHVVDI